METAVGKGLAQKLLLEKEFGPELSKMMLAVFMRVCRTLEVADGSDPLSNTIARTVITIASEGERDPDILYERTLSRFHPAS